jgi:hypothetical protein
MGKHDIRTPVESILETIKDEFRHDPETGEIFRRVGTLTTSKSNDYSRIVVNVGGKTYLCAHIIWFLEFGKWPEKMINHINGVSTDNAITNLEEVSHSANLLGKRKNRRELPIGVYKKRDRFQARITAKGVFRTIGNYATPEEAEKAFITEHLRTFGKHSRYYGGKRAQRFGS